MSKYKKEFVFLKDGTKGNIIEITKKGYIIVIGCGLDKIIKEIKEEEIEGNIPF